MDICTDKGDQAGKMLPALTAMLDMEDRETVMNAAGTMGTLVGAHTVSSQAIMCEYMCFPI